MIAVRVGSDGGIRAVDGMLPRLRVCVWLLAPIHVSRSRSGGWSSVVGRQAERLASARVLLPTAHPSLGNHHRHSALPVWRRRGRRRCVPICAGSSTTTTRCAAIDSQTGSLLPAVCSAVRPLRPLGGSSRHHPPRGGRARRRHQVPIGPTINRARQTRSTF